MAEGDVKLGSAHIDIEARNNKLIVGLNEAVNRTEKAGKAMESAIKRSTNTIESAFQKAKLDFDTTLPKMKIKDLETTYRKLQAEFERKMNTPNISVASLELTAMKLNRVGAAMKVMRGDASAGMSTMIGFNRVIQDSPYGILGVANNIQMLSEQFAFLVRQTGSVRAAIAAMTATLSGVGGVLFAITAVTTVLQLMSMQQMRSKDTTSDLTDEIENQLDKMWDLRQRLEDLSTPYEEAIKLNKELRAEMAKTSEAELKAYQTAKDLIDAQIAAGGTRRMIQVGDVRREVFQPFTPSQLKNLQDQSDKLAQRIKTLNTQLKANTDSFDSYVKRSTEAFLASAGGVKDIEKLNVSNKVLGQVLENLKDRYDELEPTARGYLIKPIENLQKYLDLNNLSSKEEEKAAREAKKAAEERKKAALLDAQDKRLTMPFDEQIKGWQKAREERQKYFDEFAKNNIDLMGGRTFTGAMNHIAMPGLPAFDFGSQSQIMEDWIAQSEVTQAAYNTLFDSLMTGFDMVRIKAATAANDTTKFWINMANSMIAEIERILVKWALLNLFGLIGGTGGVNLFSMVAGKASGGPVMANTPYVVGEKGPELFVSNSAGTIIPNNVVNNMMNSKGIEQRLDVLNANLIQQSVNRRYDKLQIEGQTDIANETIRVSYQRADKIYKRLS
jgi:hypothetical protein